MDNQAPRQATIQRTTKETDITLALKLDGRGQASINTGVAFMDHMLTLFTVHGFFDLEINATGDTEVDDHHTVEDLGICLGQAIRASLADFAGICRYGNCSVPMDETLATVTMDISNRPYLFYSIPATDQKIGTFDTVLAKEFFRALVLHAGMTVHIDVVRGENSHHIIEAIFKAFGRALRQGVEQDHRLQGTLSSKGSL
jgi:imidazoleglycerol-phosphate dehydratase